MENFIKPISYDWGKRHYCSNYPLNRQINNSNRIDVNGQGNRYAKESSAVFKLSQQATRPCLKESEKMEKTRVLDSICWLWDIKKYHQLFLRGNPFEFGFWHCRKRILRPDFYPLVCCVDGMFACNWRWYTIPYDDYEQKSRPMLGTRPLWYRGPLGSSWAC